MHFGSRGPTQNFFSLPAVCVSDTSQKCIDQEGMGGRPTQPTRDNEGNGFSMSIVLLPGVLITSFARDVCANN